MYIEKGMNQSAYSIGKEHCMVRNKIVSLSEVRNRACPCTLRRGIILFLIFFSAFAAPCQAAQTRDAVPPRIAVLPFTMDTPASLFYLQSSIHDMLSSRLAWQNRVQVVNAPGAYNAARGAKGISESEALRIGSSLKADYVLYGTIASAGQSASIEAKMIPVSGKVESVSFFIQTKTLDDILPQVNIFAQQISQKISGKPEEKTQPAAAEAETLATRDPELLLPGAMASRDKISYLNPGFVNAATEDAQKSQSLWQSQDIHGGILGMDVGDVDGDGKDEIVVVQARKLTVYKKENQELRTVATFEGTDNDRFAWVSVADVNNDGKAFIFLTSIRIKVKSSSGEAAMELPRQTDSISSFVLSVSGGKVQVIAKDLPYLLNAVHLGRRGKILIGQKQEDKHENALSGSIYEMQLRSGSLSQGPAVNVPKDVNVFNFAQVDLKNDRVERVVTFDESHKLRVLGLNGEQIWKGVGIWGATTNNFQTKVDAIPSPILIADLRQNGTQEIVLNRNAPSLERWSSDPRKYCAKGEVVSLSWDNTTLSDNWRTREFNGEITSLRIGDLDGKGMKQLVIGMAYPKDAAKLWDATSVIVTYDLNVKPGPTKQVADERETIPIQAEKSSSKSDEGGIFGRKKSSQ
jgi:TolB-like protein